MHRNNLIGQAPWKQRKQITGVSISNTIWNLILDEGVASRKRRSMLLHFFTIPIRITYITSRVVRYITRYCNVATSLRMIEHDDPPPLIIERITIQLERIGVSSRSNDLPAEVINLTIRISLPSLWTHLFFSYGQTLIRSDILSAAAYQPRNLNNSRHDYRQGEPVVRSSFAAMPADSCN